MTLSPKPKTPKRHPQCNLNPKPSDAAADDDDGDDSDDHGDNTMIIVIMDDDDDDGPGGDGFPTTESRSGSSSRQ